MADEKDLVRDELPDNLNVSAYVGPYQFPDNSRRHKPGMLYLGVAVLLVAMWFAWNDSSPMVTEGFLWAALLLAVVGV